jgi:hypothetical protein
MLIACRRTSTTAAAALSFLICAIAANCAHAAETPALTLLREIQTLQARHEFLAPELLPPLLELGRLYAAGQCDRAIDILDLALEISRRHEGLFNPAQLDIYEPLLNCYVTLDFPSQVKRAQQYVILIDEQRCYGRNDLRLLPTLDQAARRYEEVGLYLSARKAQRRAFDIARRNAGENDLLLVGSLRGIARAFRLEYAYGLAPADLIDAPYEAPDIVSSATFDGTRLRLDKLGQRSLERAVTILRNSTGADRKKYLDTLMELGDWHQLADHRREALQTYRELWRELGAAPTGEHADLLSSPEALLAPLRSGSRLRRPPSENNRYEKYTVDLGYSVTREGRVEGIVITESNASTVTENRLARDLKQTRYRPRFVDGEPVDTVNLHQRQNFYGPPTARENTALAAK